jgi:CPA1 family monovalent cation:H+ antiporter
LQLPVILDELSGEPAGTLLVYALIVCSTVILVRILGVYATTYIPRFLFRRIRERDPYPPWQYPGFVSWAGMRGAVSLAAALALPLTTDAGAAFPHRDLILFLSFCVVLATLVGQGLTMPLVIRVLGLESDHLSESEEANARIRAAEAALARLEQLVEEDWVEPDAAERLRGLYSFRRSRFAARYERDEESTHEEQQLAYQRLRRELIDAEREVLDRLRRDGVITEQVVQRVVRDLDLEDLRLDA